MSIITAKEDDPSSSRLTDLASLDTIPWYKKTNLRFLYFILVPTGLGVEWTSGFDSSMMNSLQAVKSWVDYFDNPTSSRLGLLNAMYSLGALMSIPFIPKTSHLLGRRYTILLSSLIMILGASLQASSFNSHMFLASRWILGFGIPFAIVNASALIGELSYAKERAIMTSLFNASWFIGAIIAAGITYVTFGMDSTWGWRLPSLLQIVPSLCQVLGVWFCPESPRWLVARDRGEEALGILRKYHGEGIGGEEFVRLEYALIKGSLEMEKQIASKGDGWIGWWKDVMRDKGMRKRFIIAGVMGFFTQWSGNGLLSFYMKKILGLVGIRDDRRVQQVILGNTCWGLVNAVPIAFWAPRFKRRVMFLTCTVGTGVVYLVWTVASARASIEGEGTKAGVAVLVFIFVYSPFYNIGWNALAYTYLVELFPFQQRSKGIAFEQLTVRFAVFFNTYINPIALDAIGWKYYIVYCIWICVEVLTVYLLFPETYNRTLEELSFMFEGKEVQDRVRQNVDKVLSVELGVIGRKDGQKVSSRNEIERV
ncbi:lactose permease [Podospora fimiseda]|uniref:Lactose permease n=1 Tax=Podospora fimiseda TaxID=252190 RepID=A0AAN6YSS2_9PEZI|nr:lactose permease [Podospora fimiseda]